MQCDSLEKKLFDYSKFFCWIICGLRLSTTTSQYYCFLFAELKSCGIPSLGQVATTLPSNMAV